jgi:general secretion pathway protein K
VLNCPDQDEDYAMALIAVLWGVALLSIIATTFLWSGSVSYRVARNSIETAQVDAIAEAAVARAAISLLTSRSDLRWRVDGVAYSFNFGGEVGKISIQDELGRIDLNHADRGLLLGLFQSVGLGVEAASRLVDKILDWRESGLARRLNGATTQDYRAAGHAYLPRNGAFQSVDELKLVMDMTPELFRRVEPAVTVYSGSQFIDPRVAPREALLALPGMDPSKAASIVATRTTAASVPVASNLSAASMSVVGRAFAIRTEIDKPHGTLVRGAVIRLTDDPNNPYWVLSWVAK